MDMVSYHFGFTYAYGKYNTNSNTSSIGNKIMIETIILMCIPFSVFGIYLLISDPTDNRSIWQKFHSMMKAGRLNKVLKVTQRK